MSLLFTPLLGLIAAPMETPLSQTGTDTLAATSAPIANAIAQAAGFGTVDFFGLFNIFVGLMIVASILIFGAGVIIWLVRIGTIARVEGVRTMEWGVVILFVLVVLLAIVQYFQSHPWAATFVVSLIILFFIIWLVAEATKGGGEKKKEEK